MDTSGQGAVTTDSLGRRTGPRRQHTIEEKRRIVKETHAYGNSVAEVARRHGVNPNQVFAWRRLYRSGLLKESSQEPAAMLPVKVSTPTVLPSKAATDAVKPRSTSALGTGAIEIELPNGYCVRVQGRVDAKVLSQVLELVVRR